MDTVVVRNPDKSRFEILQDNELLGFADFEMHDSLMVMPHTEINPAHGGKGYGGVLVDFALNYAIEHSLTVDPVCPFVSKAIHKNQDKYLQLVPQYLRAKYRL